MKRCKMMNRLFYICFVILFLAGCSPVNVQYDYDREADFENIHTYAWKNSSRPDNALEENPLVKKRVVRSVENTLGVKGYKKTTDNIPDFYVVIHAGVKEKMRVTNMGGPAGHYPDPWYSPWYSGGAYYGNRVDIHYYTEGTLIIDVVNAGKNELIWRGAGTGIVKQYENQEKMQQSIDTYVNEILAGFPPGSVKEQKSAAQ